MTPLPFKTSVKMILFFLNIIILFGLGVYGHASLRHDMSLIVEREVNIFDVFSRRVELVDPSELLLYIDSDYTPFSNSNNAQVFVYGYELTSRSRFALHPIIATSNAPLATYRYILSYPEVVGLYLLTNQKILIGLSSERAFIPEKLEDQQNDLFKSKPWLHYFGCDDFITKNVLCSKDPSFVSDINEDLLTHKKIIVLYYPFHLFNYQKDKYQHGLIGIDIDIQNTFKYALNPFEQSNPTQSLISFHVPECPQFYICFQQEMMRTKANSPLYLIWHYRIDDFIYRQLKGSAFILTLIAYLTAIFTWSRISPKITKHFHKDKLTSLPRRDLLDEVTFQKYNYLLLVDIDNFKSINDSYGHDVGDLVLKNFAEKIRMQLRGEDLALRWGGEEFLILLQTPKNLETIGPVVMRLFEPLFLDEIESPVTMSGGLVKIMPSHTIDKATKIADKLLYEVKQNGKNNVAIKESGKTILLINRDADIYKK